VPQLLIFRAHSGLTLGGKKWFLITADYAFGHDLEKQAAEAVKASGGEVLGAVPSSPRHGGLRLVPAAGAGLRRRDHRH